MMHTKPENPFRLFWDLGFRDLLPVTPPNAIDKAGEPMVSAGKAPGVYDEKRGCWWRKGFDKFSPIESDLDAWHRWGASVGLRGGDDLFFVDIDHMDSASAKRLRELTEAHLGKSFARVGQPPKLALPYRSTSLVRSRSIKFASGVVGGKAPGLDIISTNPFAVVAGTHAATGLPYDWPDGYPHKDQLPEVTPEQVNALLAAINEEFPFGTTSAERERDDDRPIPPQENLLGDVEFLDDAIKHIPNSFAVFGREDYIDVGYAIKAAYGPDNEAYAFEMFQYWCSRAKDGEQKWDEVEKDWGGMKPPFRIGANYIYNLAAREGGWKKPKPVVEKQTKDWHDHLDTIAPDFFTPQDMEIPEGVDYTPPKPKERKRVELLTDHDLQTRPNPKWLIEHHIPQDGVGILYGEPGAGKSFVALDMALHIATRAESWHGEEIKGAERGAVLYIAGEGAGDFKIRVAAWKKQNFPPEEFVPNDRFRAILDPLDFRSEEDVKALVEAIREADLPKLSFVVIDTVARATPGADENSSLDMGLFIRACDAVRVITGAFVLAVHHPNKTGGLRGSTALLGAADVVYRFDRKKGQFYGRLKCEKMKAGRDDFETPFRLDVIELAEDVSSLVPTRVEETEAKKAVCDEATEAAIHEAIRQAWDAGAPWSMAAQARDRFAPRIISARWNVAAEVAQQWLDLWLHGPERSLEVALVDPRTKAKGLRSLKGNGTAGQDGSSYSEGVFE